jgi:hypothetical protein
LFPLFTFLASASIENSLTTAPNDPLPLSSIKCKTSCYYFKIHHSCSFYGNKILLSNTKGFMYARNVNNGNNCKI